MTAHSPLHPSIHTYIDRYKEFTKSETATTDKGRLHWQMSLNNKKTGYQHKKETCFYMAIRRE